MHMSVKRGSSLATGKQSVELHMPWAARAPTPHHHTYAPRNYCVIDLSTKLFQLPWHLTMSFRFVAEPAVLRNA